MKVRLDKLLANLGYGSRREIAALARARRIHLDGVPIVSVEDRIEAGPDLSARLSIDGVRCDPPPGLIVMMHKPLGFTCSHKDAGNLVYRLLPARWRLREPPLSSVGRLDKETSGLLLLTDDGVLLHKIISPKTHLSKRYSATLARPLQGDETAIFAAGTLMLDGEAKPLLPAQLVVMDPQHASLTITEGRYHQVRRMFAAVGNHVVSLHRDRIGGLDLDAALEPGAFVVLGPEQLKLIWNGPNEPAAA